MNFRLASVIKLSVLYFLAFTLFGAGETLMAYLFELIGLGKLGQANVFSMYAGFFISAFFGKSLLNLFKSLKMAIFVGFLFYTNLMLSGMFAFYCKHDNFEGACSKDSVRWFNYIAAFLLGCPGGALVWTGQYEFIDWMGDTQAEIKQFFSIFFGILQISTITGNVFNLLFYSFTFDTQFYFRVLFFLTLGLTVLILIILPSKKPATNVEVDGNGIVDEEIRAKNTEPKNEIEKENVGLEANQNIPVLDVQPDQRRGRDQEQLGNQEVTIKESLNKFFTLLFVPNILRIWPYMILSGVFQGYLASAIYRLVLIVYKDSDQDFNKRVISVIMIGHGIAGCLTSALLGSLKINLLTTTMKINALLTAAVMLLVYTFDHLVTEMWIIVIVGFITGGINVTFNITNSTYMSTVYPGTTEAFLIFKQFQNLFTAVFAIFFIILSESAFKITFSVLCTVLTVAFVLTKMDDLSHEEANKSPTNESINLKKAL